MRTSPGLGGLGEGHWTGFPALAVSAVEASQPHCHRGQDQAVSSSPHSALYFLPLWLEMGLTWSLQQSPRSNCIPASPVLRSTPKALRPCLQIRSNSSGDSTH